MTVFYCYDDGKVPNLWARWLADQDARTKKRYFTVVRMLQSMNPWRNPVFHPLGSDGIGQIIIDATLQWRILGFHNGQRTEFTAVLVCSHDGRKYYPPDAKATAERRMASLASGTAMRLPCDPPS